MKEEVRRHFSEKFKELDHKRPQLEGIDLTVLSHSERCYQEDHFTKHEIQEAVWGCEGSKSPSPDGYNFYFIKKCWHFMKEDFVRFINEFHRKAKISKSITSYFLTLISKSKSPKRLTIIDQYA